ncbi:MAG TPA: prepilin peptidase [Bryobacterales bacterium]|nr:prepilin peptidase [Bryobacterales bacterium]
MTIPLIPALVFFFLLGSLVGSFLHVCIFRWPRDESVVAPRSHCLSCGKTVAWGDLIPILSYLLLRGKCRWCGASISAQYPVVELLNGLLYAYLFWQHGLDPVALKLALFGSMMLVLIFADWRDYILPDEITIGGTVIGWLLSPFLLLDGGPLKLVLMMLDKQYEPWVVSVLESFAASLLIAGFLFLLGEGYYRLRQVEGLGFGDVKMVAMIGAFWGFGTALMTLILGSILGSVVGIVIVLVSRRGWDYALPFGSYLGATAILVTLWGDDILNWYLQAIS